MHTLGSIGCIGCSTSKSYVTSRSLTILQFSFISPSLVLASDESSERFYEESYVPNSHTSPTNADYEESTSSNDGLNYTELSALSSLQLQSEFDEETKLPLSPTSSVCSSSSSIQFDAPREETDKDTSSFGMMVTGKILSPYCMEDEEATNVPTVAEMKPEGRTLLHSDMKLF